MRRAPTEADKQWAKALRKGERLSLFPEWGMWIGLTAATLVMAAPLVIAVYALAYPALLPQRLTFWQAAPYAAVSAILLGIVGVAWAQKWNCAIQLLPGELHYWDWRGREHRMRWDDVRTMHPHLLRWRVTVTAETDGTPRKLSIDYGVDARREAIVAEIVRRADLESERPRVESLPLGAYRWRRKPAEESPPHHRQRAA